MDKIVDQIKQYIAKLIGWFSSKSEPQNPADTEYNKRAQTEYKKKLNAFTETNGCPTDEQDVILYAQAYQMQITKNPTSAKFPPFEEFSVALNEGVYTVTGYLDATNSYGAQVRGNMKLNITKKDGQWVCTDKHTSLQAIYTYLIIGSILVSVIAMIYYMIQLSQF